LNFRFKLCFFLVGIIQIIQKILGFSFALFKRVHLFRKLGNRIIIGSIFSQLIEPPKRLLDILNRCLYVFL
jgi:hypothetical protein